MSKNSTLSFPRFDIPEAQKREDFHKQCTLAIINATLNNTYDLAYKSMNECYQFYNGTQSGDEFDYLQKSEDGSVLPASWINFNKIKNKVDLLIGDLYTRGYEIKVKALNKEAVSRKIDAKNRKKVAMRLRPLEQELEGKYNMKLSSGEKLPKDDEELEEFFEYRYKEKTEIVMSAALNYLAKRDDLEYIRAALFRDILIAGRCFIKNEIVNGIPRKRRIDPRFMVFDPEATDDFLSDSSYFGEVRYLTIGEAAEEYGLKLEEIEELRNSSESNVMASNLYFDAAFNELVKNVSVPFYKRERGELRILVVSAVWQDTETIKHKKSEDKYNGEHLKKVKDTYKGEDAISNRIQIWRKGTIIGGKILKHWGKCTNQVRHSESLSKAKAPYVALIPNYINGNGISKVQQLQGLQNLKNITMYNIQLAMSRAGAKGFMYDVAQCPDDWDVHTVIKYLKTVGIAFIDSKKDGIPAQYNQFQSIDMTLSSSVQQYLQISAMIDAEMDSISGVNEARQGLIQSASQAVGVTQSAITQSSLQTEPYFRMFDDMIGRVLTNEAALVKLAWANKERFSPIIGDVGIDFLQEDIELDLDDYGVFIEATPKILKDKGMLEQLVISALQSGQIDFLNGLKILKEEDITVAIRQFERAMKEAEEKAAKKQEQEYQQQQALVAQQGQQQMQLKQMDAQIELGSKRAMSAEEFQFEMKKIMLEGQIELNKEKIKSLSKVNENFFK
jgi:hypothetical protein